MPNVETYIGTPSKNERTQDLEFELDADFQTNILNICELARSVFDANYCHIFTVHEQEIVSIIDSGTSPHEITDPEVSTLPQQGVVETVVAKNRPSTTENQSAPYLHVTSPIIMPSGLQFGYFEFYRQDVKKLSKKEKAILRILQKDITNHLIQYRQIFEDANSKELQTLISKNNRDWIFVKDDAFRIVYANDAFMNVYPEEKRDKVIGYTTIEEYEKEEADIFLEQDRIAFAEGLSVVTEDLHMPDGSRMIVETIKRRFEDKNGKPYILCVCKDITEKERLIRDLQKANNELDQFTSIASHDLKSPLNAIRRLLEWVEEDCREVLPEESKENIRLVVSRAARMHTLLDDLLAYAKIGKQSESPSEVSLDELLQEIKELLDIPENINISQENKILNVPALPFKTVMLNLVGNAVKHNDKEIGEVQISVSESRHYYEIAIKDNGPGIEPKYFKRIFQLFQTLKSRDEIEGSGIGLSVVNKHVNYYGGRIEVDSDGKHGSTFTLIWPKQDQQGYSHDA